MAQIERPQVVIIGGGFGGLSAAQALKSAQVDVTLIDREQGSIKPFVTPDFDGSKLEVYAVLLDRDDNLWVATQGKGLFRIHGNVVDHYGRTDGLSSDAVSGLFEDREGILWAATTNGVDSFRDPRVTTFSALEGLGKDAAFGVLASRDGTIWVANDGSLDHIEKSGTIDSIRTGSGLPGHQVTSLLEDRAGNMWIGVDDGLFLFKDGRFRRLPEPNNKPLGLIAGMAEDIDGNIWAESAGKPGRLLRIRDFQMREEFTEPQVPAGRALAPDPQGGIWMSTTKGDLALIRQGTPQIFPIHPKGNLLSRRIMVSRDGSVLAGYDDGLVGLRQGKVQRMTTKNGLPCDEVMSFIEDQRKHWWLYTQCGIVEIADSELQRWWTNPEAIIQTRIFDALDGARLATAGLFNPVANSPDGRLWFAAGGIVQMVDPARISQKALPAMTYIEAVIVDRKEFAATNNLRIAARPREVQFDYTSPTFAIPQR
jgi:ligand-binding sensor domain-containing protein